ncbi:hypothetical protein ScPMuIL_013835 [Solemya velum]
MASSDDVSDTPYWIKFFTGAGIPAGEAANHAVTFTDHRIQKDMLMDLTKEYLNDMGITKMGDVIAILKHSKAVHTKDVRDKALQSASHVTLTSKSTSRTASPIPRRATAASRMVEHYIGNEPSASPLNKPPSPKLSAGLSARLGTSTSASSGSHFDCVVPIMNQTPQLVNQYGFYCNIIFDKVTIQTILHCLVVGKSSVFERLGSESPSNGSKVTITDGNIIVKSSQPSSVFKRLGGKTTVKRAATSTSDDISSTGIEVESSGPALEYEGILKPSSNKRLKMTKVVVTQTVPAKKKTVAKVTEEFKTEGILSSGARSEQLTLKDRLGRKVGTGVVSSTTDSHMVSQSKLKVTKSLKSRLGPKIAKAASTTSIGVTQVKTKKPKGVFSRLGSKTPN